MAVPQSSRAFRTSTISMSLIPLLKASQSGSPVDPVTFGISTAIRPGVTLPRSCTNAGLARPNAGLARPRLRFRLRAVSDVRLRFCPDFRLTPIRFWVSFPCFVMTVPTTRYVAGARDSVKRPVRPTGRAAATVPVARLTARTSACAPFGTLIPSEPAKVPGLADAFAAVARSTVTASPTATDVRLAVIEASCA
jgi:hypothetical protein